MLREKLYCFGVLAVFCICGLFPQTSQAADKFKVLVVMSYDEDYPWNKEIKEGIDCSVPAETCEMKYFYMDTKRNPQGGEEKAKEAYTLYQEFQPDGVIAADDNAQSMFVVPYLKDKVRTPIMFCGVNATPEKYGYPGSNVSGILERQHLRESIAFVQQLVPSVKVLGVMTADNPTGRALVQIIQSNSDTYSVESVIFKLPKKLKEAVTMAKELREQCDVLLLHALQGLRDESGKALTEKDVVPILTETFGKPTIGGVIYMVKYGVLCAIISRGQEQGETAAKMLLQAMQGTPLSQIPITRNKNGKAFINVITMKALGIKPKPMALKGVELVKTEKQ